MLGIGVNSTKLSALSQGAFGAPTGAILDVDFVRDIYKSYDALGTLASVGGNFTRASVADWLASDGVSIAPQAGINVLRRDGRGALIEAGVTAKAVNSLMVGGAAGSPGTLPSNIFIATPTGLTRTIVLGVTGGVQWCEIQLAGTTTSANDFSVQFGPAATFAALNGQLWTGSVLASVNADPAITDLALAVVEDDAASVYLAGSTTSFAASRQAWTRKSQSRILNHAAILFNPCNMGRIVSFDFCIVLR